MEGSTETKSPKFTRKVRRGLFTLLAAFPDDVGERLRAMGTKGPAVKDALAAVAWLRANAINPDALGLDPSTPSGIEPAQDGEEVPA